MQVKKRSDSAGLVKPRLQALQTQDKSCGLLSEMAIQDYRATSGPGLELMAH